MGLGQPQSQQRKLQGLQKMNARNYTNENCHATVVDRNAPAPHLLRPYSTCWNVNAVLLMGTQLANSQAILFFCLETTTSNDIRRRDYSMHTIWLQTVW